MAAPLPQRPAPNTDVVLERTKDLLRTTTRRIQLTKDTERVEAECKTALARALAPGATPDDQVAARRALGRRNALRVEAAAVQESEAQLKVLCPLRPGDPGFDGAAPAEPPAASDEELEAAIRSLRSEREAAIASIMRRAAAAGLPAAAPPS